MFKSTCPLSLLSKKVSKLEKWAKPKPSRPPPPPLRAAVFNLLTMCNHPSFIDNFQPATFLGRNRNFLPGTSLLSGTCPEPKHFHWVQNLHVALFFLAWPTNEQRLRTFFCPDHNPVIGFSSGQNPDLLKTHCYFSCNPDHILELAHDAVVASSGTSNLHYVSFK